MSTWIASPAFNTPDSGGGSGGDGDGGGGHDIDIPIEFVFYAIIAIFLMVLVLMIKLLCDTEGGRGGEERGRARESSRLLSSKEKDLFIDYGTAINDEDDIEARNENGSCSSSSDDLYDGKICVICYDDQRTCFFIPCGHCITCFTCAKRIISEDNKSCPICRTCINRVRVLHVHE